MKVNLIDNIIVFNKFSKKDKTILQKFVFARSFKTDEIIYKIGTPPVAMYFLTSGSVGLYMKDEKKTDHRVQYIPPYQFFGYSALISDDLRRVTARALEPCETILLLRSDYLQIVNEYPKLAFKLLPEITSFIHQHLVSSQSDYMNLTNQLAQSNILF